MYDNGALLEYFSSPLTAADARKFQVEIGSDEGQQTWEALAMLVALRHWGGAHWQRSRCTLEVAGDNMSALILLTDLKNKSRSINIVARGLAFELGDSLYRPDIVTHIPGLSNKLADYLSRLMAPDGPPVARPAALDHAEQTSPAARTPSWYLAMRV